MSGVISRHLQSGRIEGAVCLAVTETEKGQVATFTSGTDAARVMGALSLHAAVFRRAGSGLIAILPGGLAGVPSETSILADKHVLLAMRNAETADSTVEWLKYHAEFGVDGALIFVRGRREDAMKFGKELDALHLPDVEIIVVSADVPLGRRDRPDARKPTSAPAAPTRDTGTIEPDPWHSDLGEEVIYETLRHRFLSEAQTVTTLDVGEYLLPAGDFAFERAAREPRKVIMLRGRETYAWSGRACAADHVYVRRSEKRWLTRWSVSPRALTPDTIWREKGVFGVKAASPQSAFVRAMGQRFPTADRDETVEASDLIEDREVSRHFESAFGRQSVRRPVTTFDVPRRPVVVVTTMKNEGPYIVDWIAHHRVVGIDNFLVYTNDCSDDTAVLLRALAAEGIVQHRENPCRELGGAPQRAAFRAARNEPLVQKAAWLLPLDVDEYLNVHVGDGTLADLFAALPEGTVLSIPWRLFGNDTCDTFIDKPVVEQFRRAAPDYAPRPLQAWGFKTLFRNDGSFERIGVHAPRGLRPDRAADVVWLDAMGRPLPDFHWEKAWRMTPTTWGYAFCQINHYSVRSAEAFLVKRERGRTNHTKQDQGSAYWFRMNFNGPKEVSIDRYSARVNQERERLMALPKVAEAHRNSVNWHRARANDLKVHPDYRDLWDEITGRRARALSRRLGHFGNNVFFLGPEVVPDDIVARPVHGEWEFTVPLPKRAENESG